MNDNDTGKPLFLTPEGAQSEPEIPAEYLEQQYVPANARHRKIAQLFADGKTNKEVCETMKMSGSRISVIKHDPATQQMITEYQDRMFESSLDDRMKELGPDAMNVIESILRDKEIPITKKENMAKWLVEKRTGKATQSVDVRGEISVGVYMDKVDQLIAQNLPIDVTPKNQQIEGESGETEPEADKLADWVKDNI